MAKLTDAQQKDMGKTVKVGFGQITNPTPQLAKTFFRIISFATGLWAIAQQMDLGLPSSIIDKVNMWCVAAIPFTHFAIKFFGWDYKND